MQAFCLKTPSQVALVGGGGKTSLMFALAAEAAAAGYRVITTTTTRILMPEARQSSRVILAADEQDLALKISAAWQETRHVTVAREQAADNKLLGLAPEILERLARLADLIINEADGAACRPIKAPNLTEPVIPAGTGMVIAVLGVDALGAILDRAHTFRPELISAVTGLDIGGIITAETIARLVTHPQGIIQHSPQAAVIIPFINKIDLADYRTGLYLADAILARNHPQIKRVVFGSLQDMRQPVISVQSKGDSA
jgi:probable selenium-dependent hydroxylase accessory protein YqeC